MDGVCARQRSLLIWTTKDHKIKFCLGSRKRSIVCGRISYFLRQTEMNTHRFATGVKIKNQQVEKRGFFKRGFDYLSGVNYNGYQMQR